MRHPHVRTRQASCALSGSILLVLAACSSSTDPGGGNADFTAVIDGTPFTAAAASTQANGFANGAFTIVGATGTSPVTALSLSLFNIAGPGTYPLGVGGTVTGGLGTLVSGSSSASTPLSGSAGTVTITAVSATHITGTFAFTTPGHTVTEGVFDLPVTSTGSIAVAPNSGGSVTGTVGGSPWTAATVVMVSAPSSGTVSVGFSNDAYLINFIISGFTGTGTYTMNTGVARQGSATVPGTLQSWGGTAASSSGTFVVTTATESRLAGTYDVTLQPATGSTTGTLRLTGAFDIGITP